MQSFAFIVREQGMILRVFHVHFVQTRIKRFQQQNSFFGAFLLAMKGCRVSTPTISKSTGNPVEERWKNIDVHSAV